MICKSCGSDVPDDIKFCPGCGAPVSNDEATGTDTGSAYEARSGSAEPERVYGAPMGHGKNRNIALCIIFSIITCGIYSIYWMYVLNEEINSLSDEPNATSGGLVILFTIITCGIYGLYWYFKMGERVDTIKTNMGLRGDSSNIIFLILGIFGLGIINYALMQDTINKAVA